MDLPSPAQPLRTLAETRETLGAGREGTSVLGAGLQGLGSAFPATLPGPSLQILTSRAPHHCGHPLVSPSLG